MSYPWNSFDTLTAADLNAAIGMAASSGTTVAGGTNNVGRNLIHNSMFNVQQRGVGTFSTNGSYTADRWYMVFAGGSLQISLFGIDIPSAIAIGDEAAKNMLTLTFTGTGGASDYSTITQRIEGVRSLSGKTVTVSFYAVASVAGLKFGVGAYQVFGTGGTGISPGVGDNGQSVTLTAGWARYSVTLSIPSVSGKTFGTNHDDFTQISFYASAGSNYVPGSGAVPVQSGSISMWGVQLEVGTVATPLEKLDPVTQLQQCQRFYCNIPGFMMAGTYGITSSNLLATCQFPVTMRAAPTSVTFANTAYAGGSAIAVNGTPNPSLVRLQFTTSTAGYAWAQSDVLASADL